LELRLRDLAECRAHELRPLLEEEQLHWRAELGWDFRDVAAAVADGIDRRALCGRVAQLGQEPVAYCYALPDTGRLVVGSLFALTTARGQGLEERLLSSVLREAQATGGTARIECQTLFCTAREPERAFHEAGFATRRRHYLLRALDGSWPVADSPYALRPFRRGDVALAAQIVHRSHIGSLDAALNLTYASRALCQAFLETLVQRGGCGPFEPRASFVAEGPRGAVGVILASRLSDNNGHVCQVSVVPELQGRGLGSALLSSTLDAFRAAGLSNASLSVTVENRRAYGLYEALGFRPQRQFAAHAWVRPPAHLELPA
jgi:ribosomal protein S18 acetylase RimI-like enzyme